MHLQTEDPEGYCSFVLVSHASNMTGWKLAGVCEAEGNQTSQMRQDEEQDPEGVNCQSSKALRL